MAERPPDDSRIDDGRAALLCSSPDPRGSCLDAAVPSGAEAIDLLIVSFTGSPVDRLEAVRDRGLVVERSAVASVDDDPDEPGPVDRTYAVESVESVDRLSDLGMYIRDVVVEWAYDGNPSVVCFDAVDDLLARADLEVVFEFLLVVVEGIRPWGALAHFHFDPEAHDGATRRTLEPLFDEVVGLED